MTFYVSGLLLFGLALCGVAEDVHLESQLGKVEEPLGGLGTPTGPFVEMHRGDMQERDPERVRSPVLESWMETCNGKETPTAKDGQERWVEFEPLPADRA